jgi:hypothetical protein
MADDLSAYQAMVVASIVFAHDNLENESRSVLERYFSNKIHTR